MREVRCVCQKCSVEKTLLAIYFGNIFNCVCTATFASISCALYALINCKTHPPTPGKGASMSVMCVRHSWTWRTPSSQNWRTIQCLWRTNLKKFDGPFPDIDWPFDAPYIVLSVYTVQIYVRTYVRKVWILKKKSLNLYIGSTDNIFLHVFRCIY